MDFDDLIESEFKSDTYKEAPKKQSANFSQVPATSDEWDDDVPKSTAAKGKQPNYTKE